MGSEISKFAQPLFNHAFLRQISLQSLIPEKIAEHESQQFFQRPELMLKLLFGCRAEFLRKPDLPDLCHAAAPARMNMPRIRDQIADAINRSSACNPTSKRMAANTP